MGQFAAQRFRDIHERSPDVSNLCHRHPCRRSTEADRQERMCPRHHHGDAPPADLVLPVIQRIAPAANLLQFLQVCIGIGDRPLRERRHSLTRENLANPVRRQDGGDCLASAVEWIGSRLPTRAERRIDLVLSTISRYTTRVPSKIPRLAVSSKVLRKVSRRGRAMWERISERRMCIGRNAEPRT